MRTIAVCILGGLVSPLVLAVATRLTKARYEGALAELRRKVKQRDERVDLLERANHALAGLKWKVKQRDERIDLLERANHGLACELSKYKKRQQKKTRHERQRKAQ